ncbi:DUF481 domain-containing protein [Litoribacter ruber]|uniref:DUF481 domain-containing protein n=1 Tax=Litoribacter ruber TaxID=702568 RepID=UPI001BDA20D3|nr:DUF481 domain-containing protein [Litoribacter ruber]MBT0811441.1 DUF481 domain-containing protein [Litoribacter ruber]
MRYFFLLIFFIFISSITGLAQEKDTLYIKNQSPLVGKLERIQFGVVRFNADNVGRVEVDVTNVKTFRTYGFGYRVQTANREFYIGIFKTHEEEGRVRILTGFDEIDIAIRNLNEVNLLRENFLERVQGRATAGYTFSRSSNIGLWNGSLELGYDTERLDIDLTGSIIVSQEEGGFSRDRENVLLIANYYLSPSWHAWGLGNYQRNLQLGILRRLQQGAGLGIFAIQDKRTISRLASGLVINQEVNIQRQVNSPLYEVPVILEFTFFRLRKPQLNFRTTQSLFVSLTQQGRIRNDGDTRLSWTVINNFEINLNFYNNFDNQPPSELGSTFDYGLVFGVGYRF